MTWVPPTYPEGCFENTDVAKYYKLKDNYVRYRGCAVFDEGLDYLYDDFDLVGQLANRIEWMGMMQGAEEITQEEFMDTWRDFLASDWQEYQEKAERIHEKLHNWDNTTCWNDVPIKHPFTMACDRPKPIEVDWKKGF